MKNWFALLAFLLIVCSIILVLPATAAVNGKIAFFSNRNPYGIYVMNADGSGQTWLSDGLAPGWSPDGTKIAFESSTGEHLGIYVMNANSLGRTLLFDAGHGEPQNPAWSPDGKKIAFSLRRMIDRDFHIVVMNSDGTGSTTELNFPHDDKIYDDTNPVWSPDSKKIAFESNRDGRSEIYLMNADGSDATNPTRLTNTLGYNREPAWSPDGKKIVFVRWNEIYVMNADGTGQVWYTYHPAIDEHPGWSQDGKKIVFESDRDNGNFDVYIMNADGSDANSPTRLTTNTASDKSPAWGPAFSITVTSPNGGENWQGGTAHKITWTQAGLAGTTVKISLYKKNALPFSKDILQSTIASAVSATAGSYSWTTAGLTSGSSYRIEVKDNTDPAIYDRSDGYFTGSSSPTAITVTSPTCGDMWQPGTTHSVKWSFTGNPGSYVKVVLMKAGVDVGTATYSTSIGSGGTGSYQWAISSGRAPGTDYQIRVESTSNPSVKGTSCKFTIGAPPASSIKVTVPNGGESWKRGTTQTVKWSYTGSPGPYVKIELLKAGVPVGTATYSTSIGTGGIGSYPWAISSGRTPGTNYRIRVTSVSQPIISDTSNSDFTITT